MNPPIFKGFMAFYQSEVYRKYTEMPSIPFLVDAQSGYGYGYGYGYELGRWVQNRHGGRTSLLLLVVVAVETHQKVILNLLFAIFTECLKN